MTTENPPSEWRKATEAECAAIRERGIAIDWHSRVDVCEVLRTVPLLGTVPLLKYRITTYGYHNQNARKQNEL